ncbi:MAG: NAD(P)-dependent oxidoreductase [Acidobacteria bacterium]|nr:NAD(P)-dependent oxidoreductase [Acidobacteriota bacterium]
MGLGMARRLLAAGFPVAVYNRSTAKAEALAEEGARVAASPASAADGADVVISMVADDAASRGLWLGDDGVLAGIRSAAVCVECSTLSPAWLEELAASVEAKGCSLLDAPVTGSKVHAERGELRFLVGGSAEALEAVRPVLQAMSREVVHLGPMGSGAKLKLINNFLCGVQAAALAEAVALVERSGLDRAQAMDVLLQGAPGSPLVKTLAPRMLGREYETNFALQLMAKDLAYAIALGGVCGVEMRTAAAAHSLFSLGCAEGRQDMDFSAVIESLRS